MFSLSLLVSLLARLHKRRSQKVLVHVEQGGMKMMRVLVMNIAALAVVLLSACSSSTSGLVGKWQNTHGYDSIEFFNDGTMTSLENGQQSSGHYRLVDGAHMAFEFDEPLLPHAERVVTFNVSGAELKIEYPNGKLGQYSRVN
ncbi:MAG: hypothetical protein K2Z81_12400 [Cyanobacteria bacterium]|nr:hypothetical protein [Cyanobacteriota bacterium]